MCIACCSSAQSFLGWWYECILRTLISCFRMNHLHSHTLTGTVIELCGQAVNPWIRPFYECWTAEGWSLSPLSACIPTRLTAVSQNTWEVSGKHWIKVCHLECHQTRDAEPHAAFKSNWLMLKKKVQLSGINTVSVLILRWKGVTRVGGNCTAHTHHT